MILGYPNANEIKPLECLIKDAAAVTSSGAQEGDADAVVEVRSLLYNDLGVQLPLHISLSRTLALSTESKDAFAETIKRLVCDSGIEPRFTLAVSSISWESNYEKTRWFLVLGIEKPPNDELNRLLRLSNTAAQSFGKPLLYENEATAKSAKQTSTVDHTNHFHISIAWTLQEPSAKGKERLSAIDLRRIKEMAIYFDCMKARIGNNVVTLPFSTRKNAQESGIGLI
ncbi:hypothetical protein KEM56_005349 [Ascosphaera pollenicola]|nr:hypothetical protein KEM56_005349 [Ascosphaera pollenicola]